MNNDITQLSLSEHMKLKLRGMMNEHTDHLATGNIKNFEEYKRMVGVIEGLALAERELLDYVEKVLKE